MRSRFVPCFLVAASSLALAGSAQAQCADGTPPPCGDRRAATAVSLPSAPRLDDRTWLVLPFENSARVADAALVSSASLTLLNQELGRWRDVKSVSDDRVADLLRQTPESQRGQLGLESALALARRAGAGRLLVGNFLAVGGRANVTARLYETRTGRLLKSTPDRLSGYASEHALDSLSATFSRLALAILEVPPAQNVQADLGTTSVEAYRAYVQGMASFNRMRWDSAAVSLERATTIDSAFAIAHLRAWRAYFQLGETPKANRHRDAATRHSARLQPRQRLLLAWGNANTPAGRRRACDAANGLLAADSSDVDGLIAAGDCAARQAVVAEPGRPPRMGAQINAAVRSYERALALDPSNAFAFSALFNLYMGGARNACATDTSVCTRDTFYLTRRSVLGDSIVEELVRYADNPYVGGNVALVDSASYHRLVQRALTLARRWSAANPSQWIGHAAYARALLYAGDFAGAERELTTSNEAAALVGDRRLYFRDRIAIALAREQLATARTLLDSLFLDPTATRQPQFATTMGVFSRDLPDGTQVTPERTALAPKYNLLYAGLLPPEGASIVTRFAEAAAAIGGPSGDGIRRTILDVGYTIAFRMTQTRPAVDTASTDPLRRFQAYFARGDTSRARTELSQALVVAHEQSFQNFTGDLLFVAEGALMLGDTATALSELQRFGRQWSRYSITGDGALGGSVMRGSYPGQSSAHRLSGRAWLLYGDLAFAKQLPTEARRAYAMVVGLWSGGEPPVQPFVERARARLRELGG